MAAPTHSERILAPDALAAVPDLVRRLGFGQHLLLVCDDATWVAAGQHLQLSMSADFELLPHSLGRAPKANMKHVEPLIVSARANQAGCAIIAIGSGTVNDVAKYAAHELGCDYICVATAASMNGYSSATASLEEGGIKRSHACRPPRAVVADLRVIANAPRRLTRAGLGDTLCRSTVAADRFLSHAVLGTPFEREIFQHLRRHESWLMQNAAQLRDGSMEYVQKLMEALLDAGDAMTEVASSAVASQGEHMIAHTLEMMYGGELREMLHGELIAVTTSSMALLQHKMLLSTPTLTHHPRDEGQFVRTFGRQAGEKLMQAYIKKVIPESDLAAVNERFAREWPEIKEELLRLIVPASGVERAYKEAGLFTTAKQLGITPEHYNAAMSYAYMTRDRFTFLDLATMNARRTY